MAGIVVIYNKYIEIFIMNIIPFLMWVPLKQVSQPEQILFYYSEQIKQNMTTHSNNEIRFRSFPDAFFYCRDFLPLVNRVFAFQLTALMKVFYI